MDYHQNARLTVHSRAQLARKVLLESFTLKQAAACFNVSAKTAAKWVGRYREQGEAGLSDHSSRPRRLYRPTDEQRVQRVEALRRERWTGVRIARHTGLSRATVSRILRQLKISRIRDLEPQPPIQRYEHKAPGDLLHLDIKKLGRFRAEDHRIHGDMSRKTRGSGWEYVHVAVDDHSRIAFSAIHPNEKADSTVAFLYAALAYYDRLGIRFKALLTDNGPAYRSRAFATACRALGLKHRFTRPTPQEPTEKPNASSKPLCANGPMSARIPTHVNAKMSCSHGCIRTTGIDRMLAWDCRHPSAALLSIGTTC